MLFNSLVFALFLPVVLAGWWALPPGPRRAWLLAASLFFYGWWDWRFLGLLVGTSFVDWCVGLALDDPRRPRRAAWLAASLGLNLLVLGLFKYYGFFAEELRTGLHALGFQRRLPALDVILPVGLSFYTFQAMAYTVDVWRGHVRAVRRFDHFLLFISFFPQLVAGPIERSRDLLPQLDAGRRPTREQLAEGGWLLLWGLFKKVVVADNLAPLVERAYEPADGPPGGLTVLLAAYAFTWQIYCDFSGYSDIARGVAKWLGVDLTVNFDLPFFAASPRELWRRWHISLSRWLRDYLYVPLGGSRGTPARTRLNLLATMVLGGLWHGANWTFLAWGAWHGAALALQRTLPPLRVPRALAIVATFHLTVLGFVVFRAHSLAQVAELAGALGSLSPTAADLAGLRLFALLAGVTFLAELAMWRRGEPLQGLLPRRAQAALTVALVLALAVLGATYGHPFLYFRF